MKKIFLYILVFSATFPAYSQKGWITLPQPESRMVGRLLQNNGVVSGSLVEPTSIITVDGPDSLIRAANSSYGIKLTGGVTFDHSKILKIQADKIVIDYLKDSLLFTNDDYLSNFFILKGARANNINIYLKKETKGLVNPVKLLDDKTRTAIAKVLPFIDSVNISFESDDSLVLTIHNPKVYFKVLACKLKPVRCKGCRTSFALGHAQQNEDDFNLDLQNKWFTDIFIPVGTKPSFRLSVAQDNLDNSKIRVLLTSSSGFQLFGAVDNILEVPHQDMMISGKSLRRFNFTRPEVYIGSINTSKDFFNLNNVSFNTPLYLSIIGEQKSSTIVNFNNINESGVLLTKIEFPEYKFELFKGNIK